ncbi:MAG: hypothetical protein HXL58_10090 [Solobacterium sp.]|nr:hypothetical protein [Solobacterium sp.]
MKSNKSILAALFILIALQIFSIVNQFRINSTLTDLMNKTKDSISLDVNSAESNIESNIDEQSSTIDEIKSSIDELNSSINY